jgi:hypothetical protein
MFGVSGVVKFLKSEQSSEENRCSIIINTFYNGDFLVSGRSRMRVVVVCDI